MFLRRNAQNNAPPLPTTMPMGPQAPYVYPPTAVHTQDTSWDESLGPGGEPLPRYEPPATPPPAFDTKIDDTPPEPYTHTPEPRPPMGPSTL